MNNDQSGVVEALQEIAGELRLIREALEAHNAYDEDEDEDEDDEDEEEDYEESEEE